MTFKLVDINKEFFEEKTVSNLFREVVVISLESLKINSIFEINENIYDFLV